MELVTRLATITLIMLLGWWLRRCGRDGDEYFERDFRDPPVFDAVDRLGGGKP